ncbi:MAG: ribosomal-processing cysteine protease Prp [Christensenellales bacterium]|jgi:uncharacterized protein YsxB (DUF464 family)
MIFIRLTPTPDGQSLSGFEVKGHAGFAPHGQDIVCAAVSFLATTCTNALESIAGIAPKVRQKDGFLAVHVRPEELNDQAATIFQVFSQGMRDLMDAYPDHVTLTTK